MPGNLEQLYVDLLDAIGEHMDIPESIPFVGSIDDYVVKWVRENPEEAESLAVDAHRVLERYLGS